MSHIPFLKLTYNLTPVFQRQSPESKTWPRWSSHIPRGIGDRHTLLQNWWHQQLYSCNDNMFNVQCYFYLGYNVQPSIFFQKNRSSWIILTSVLASAFSINRTHMGTKLRSFKQNLNIYSIYLFTSVCTRTDLLMRLPYAVVHSSFDTIVTFPSRSLEDPDPPSEVSPQPVTVARLPV